MFYSFPMNTQRQPTEDELQVYSADVISAFKVAGIIAFHCPNGGYRHPAVAKKMKAMGVLPGVPDWTFNLPGPRFAYLELKDHKGRQSEAQKQFQRDAEALGIPYLVARTPEEIDGVLSALGVINKPNSVPRRGSDAMGESGRLAGPPVGRPFSKHSRVAA